MQLEYAQDIEEFLLASLNITLISVAKDYVDTINIAKDIIGLNDCVTYIIMKKKGIEEIYSFDSDFDRLGVKRIKDI